LTENDVKHLSTSALSSKIETVKKHLQRKKTPGPDGLTAEF
jgi:hypothetical protein